MSAGGKSKANEEKYYQEDDEEDQEREIEVTDEDIAQFE
jgi:hypothetical protein